MPTKRRKLKDGTYVQHWTRKEQIANAKASDTLAEMEPKLKVP